MKMNNLDHCQKVSSVSMLH